MVHIVHDWRVQERALPYNSVAPTVNFRILTYTLACLALSSAVQAAPVVSYFPKEDLGLFLAMRFDLASIRSSVGPRRTPALRTFADFGMKPSRATQDILVYETLGDWRYELKVMARRDVNGDGIEDLEVCFSDQALNGGSYDRSKGLLLTRYSSNAYVVALIQRQG